MAQKWYLRSSGTPDISPTVTADWEHIEASPLRLTTSPTGGSTSLSSKAYSPDAADHLVNADAHVIQYISAETLAAQTISAQTVSLAVQCLESNAGNNVFLTWKIYIVNAAGTSVLGTLLAIRRDATEMATTRTNRTDSATTTEVTTSEAGRLVIELGCGGTPTGAGGVQGHNCTLFHGDNSATDLPADDADTTTTKRPWVQFTNDLTFAANTKNIAAAINMASTVSAQQTRVRLVQAFVDMSSTVSASPTRFSVKLITATIAMVMTVEAVATRFSVKFITATINMAMSVAATPTRFTTKYVTAAIEMALTLAAVVTLIVDGGGGGSPQSQSGFRSAGRRINSRR